MFVLGCSSQRTQTGKRQPDNFDCAAVTRGARHSLVARHRRAAHLVHPRTAVVPVATEHKACCRVHADGIVEPVVHHVLIDALAGVPLAERGTAPVFGQRLVDCILQRLLPGQLIAVLGLIVGRKEADHRIVKDRPAIRAAREYCTVYCRRSNHNLDVRRKNI